MQDDVAANAEEDSDDDSKKDAEAKKEGDAEEASEEEKPKKKKIDSRFEPVVGLKIIKKADPAERKRREEEREAKAATADDFKRMRPADAKEDLESLRRAAAKISRGLFSPKAPQRGSMPLPSSMKKSKKTKRQFQQERAEAAQKAQDLEEDLLTAPKIISINRPMTIAELAEGLRMKDTELILHLFMKGQVVHVNQSLDADAAIAIAKELEFEIEEEQKSDVNPGEIYESLSLEGKHFDSEKFKNLEERPPVVSIMGHVDHGKTTLLDAIRETRNNVVDTEAGGITQSIGAYTVEKGDKKIVFLDTPGHEAFTAMRMRGAKSTDIAILVVAADDGVMPQTIEAINHAKAAKIPIIVAVNKMDKPGADPGVVLGQLAQHGLASEDWGGDTLTCQISALKKEGLDSVLENILLVTEILDPKADATVEATGVIIESHMDKRVGPVATVLVQNGTIRVGENVLIGSVGGRVRALINDAGEKVESAGPSMPVEVIGLNSVPQAGEVFEVIQNEKRFKQRHSAEKLRERELRLTSRQNATAAGFAVSDEGETTAIEKQFNIITKADSQGSLEALCDLLNNLSTDEIKVNILHSGTGDISEADIMLAVPANALVVAFNVTADANAQTLSQQNNILIKEYDVIYHITDDVEKMMLGELDPEFEEIKTGEAEVRQLFTIGKTVIAGCMVLEGKIVRDAKASVERDGEIIFTGELDQLKRFKDDAKEVASGYECGVSFDKFNDLQPGDKIVVHTVKELQRTSL